jgi:hypothetical protein
MTPCTHLGEVWRHVPSKLCGTRGVHVPIYRCPLHVICTLTKYRHGQLERCCLACDDYTCQTKEAQHDSEDNAAAGS